MKTYERLYHMAITGLYNSDSILCELRAATKERADDWNITTEDSRLLSCCHRTQKPCSVCCLKRRNAHLIYPHRILTEIIRIQNLETIIHSTKLLLYVHFILSKYAFLLIILINNFPFPSGFPSLPYQSSFLFVSSWCSSCSIHFFVPFFSLFCSYLLFT